ncbi:ATP-binding cassette domain-containing protein [Williamsia soli]|uniref:ATP-binding cassette domain-containing protein n=1 Tax=Williamsia soli TaxID=364929 RepID=UPI001A9CB938|nr:ATP-binding cassette domain-containing protein [Williamsia soli]
MDEYAIEVSGLTKTFGGKFGRGEPHRALGGVDLQVKRGTVHALLGPNGAGKTTTVRVISTLLKPDEGTVTVLGTDALADPAKVRRSIGVSGQYAAVDGNLTGWENLRMVARLYGLKRKAAGARADELINDFRLTDARDRPSRTYSGGMRRRLDLAGSLIARPGVVILDEPTTGLDPRGRREMWALIENLVSTGTSVLLTTQYLEEADALADIITVIDKGVVVAKGTAAELKAASQSTLLTVEVAQGYDRDRLIAVLTEYGSGEPYSHAHSMAWHVPVAHGNASAAAIIQALSETGVMVSDFTVDAPTLDDVFLNLTSTTPDKDEERAA